MNFKILKTIDIYIIKKFLGTFFYVIVLIIGISIVFDLSEKIDDFIESEAPFRAIVFDYYLNFIPYFTNLFSGLFTFISVIYFTSKMAFNSEIISILSSGVSFKRFMRPYMISAFVICALSYTLGNYIIPPSNKKMIDFQYTYIKKKKTNNDKNIHMQLSDDTYMYIMKYRSTDDIGDKFALEKFDGHKLVSKLTASRLRWDREKKTWTLSNYVIRDIIGDKENITTGAEIDTVLNILPEEFETDEHVMETMSQPQLIEFINQQKLRGVDSLEPYEVERHRRAAVPFSSFILTLIGASFASRKMRGGIGFHLGLGIAICFTYIMFQQVTKVFALSGSVTPLLAVWIPNLVFGVIAIFIYKWAAR